MVRNDSYSLNRMNSSILCRMNSSGGLKLLLQKASRMENMCEAAWQE
jgi:hypothetical protein